MKKLKMFFYGMSGLFNTNFYIDPLLLKEQELPKNSIEEAFKNVGGYLTKAMNDFKIENKEILD